MICNVDRPSHILEADVVRRIIYLQSSRTGQFVMDGVPRWTPNLTDAREFRDTFRAAQFCVERQLLDMQMVMHFEQDGFAIQMALAVRVPRAADIEQMT